MSCNVMYASLIMAPGPGPGPVPALSLSLSGGHPWYLILSAACSFFSFAHVVFIALYSVC